MRLRRLDLTRYGKFTQFSLDFGEPDAGRPDLHIVYGPNEAGKSTALSAFLDLLFGIETRSTYNFIHPHRTMRIGAALDLGGSVQDFVRVKRPQNSLLNGFDQPVAEAAIQGELGGIDRESYCSMFSLDDKTLEAGGKSILASKGDLGQLLFSASAGLADLSRVLGDLKAEADRFYKFKAHDGALLNLKLRLGTLETDREKIDTLASEYALLIEARDRAAGQYDGTRARRGLVQARIEEIQRHLSALPRLASLRDLRKRLDPLADLPDPPRHWADELPGIQAKGIQLDVKSKTLANEVETLSAELRTIMVDEEALHHVGKVERLASLRARHITAEKDLPERRLQLRGLEGAISGLLHRIERDGEPEPGRLILGAAATARLHGLIETRSGIDAAIKATAAELLAARQRLADARAKLEAAADGKAADRNRKIVMASLVDAVAVARSGDHSARRRQAERAKEAAETVLRDRLRDLLPWQGDGDDLFGLQVPAPETVARWASEMAAAQKRLERHVEQVERLTTERLRSEAERDAIAALTGIVADQEAADIRALREQAWADHRQRLDTVSADTFEAALRHDDAVVSGRFGHVSDVAMLHQASKAIAVATAEGERARELRDVAAAVLRAIEDEIAAVLRAGVPALDGWPLPQVESWLARRDKALEARIEVRTAERELREANQDRRAACDRLDAALGALGRPQNLDTGFDELLAAAQEAIETETELAALRAAVEERQREMDIRERASEAAMAEERRWTDAWAEACSACWLREGGAAPALAIVREILPVLAELSPSLDKKASLIDRIEKMEKDQIAFRDEVVGLARQIGMSETLGAVLDLAQSIEDRIGKARAERSRHEGETRKLHGARERQLALAGSLEVHRRRAREMTAFFGVETLMEVGSRLRAAEQRDELKRQAEKAEGEVLELVRLSTLEEAERALDVSDRAALELELAGLKTDFENLDQRCQELFLARHEAEDKVEAIGGDSKVAEIEEDRRTTLLEIEDGALHYLKLRLGTAATEQALRAYRDRHRSSMMTRASEAFRTISRGAYSGLAAQPEKDGESLIALSAGGGSKQADELSTGTRFQLYLALRVAGYHEFARSRSPVPFIADDIMETFDDFRAEEAFRLFGEMARVGQVIYLTHHRHLCDIARTICPGARITEIASEAA